MIKMLIAAAGLSLGLLMAPMATAPAEAGVDIDINIGKKQISCNRGRRIVRDYGFRHVRTRNCRGRNYEYSGRRRGDRFMIKLDSRRGRIVDVRRIW